MAIFNPNPPQTNDPNYVRDSKVVDAGSLQSAVGGALKNFGNIFEEAAKGTVDYLTDVATKETRGKFEDLRDQRTSELESADRLVRYAANQQPPQAEQYGPPAPSTAQNILDTKPGPSLPEDAAQSLQGLQALKDARANGKLTATDYDGRAVSLLKDIRAKYPDGSIRRAIDQTASDVFGGDPANKKIASLMETINSYMTNTQAQRTHMFNELSTKGLQFEGGQAALSNFMKGGTIEDAAGFLNKNMSRAYKLQQDESELKLAQSQGTANQQWYTINAREHANASVHEIIHAVTWNTGIKSYDDVNKVIQQAYDGTGAPLTSDQYFQLSQMPLAWKQRALAKIDAKFSQTINGVSINGQVDPSEVKKIKEGVSEIFDTMHKALAGKDVGAAYSAMQQVQFQEADAKLRLTNSKELGQVALNINALNSVFGEKVVEQAALQDIITKLRPPFKDLINTVRTDAAVDDPRHTPEFRTFKEAQDRLMSEKTKTLPGWQEQIPKTFNRFMDMVDSPTEGMLSPNVPDSTKAKMFDFFFKPENRGALSKIKPDGRDEQGRRTVGVQSIFARFSNPDIVELAKKMGPQAQANYLDFMQTTWEQDLFKPDLMKLKGLSEVPTDRSVFTGQDKALSLYKFAWDTETHELKLIDRQNPSINFMRRAAANPNSPLGQAQDLVSRLNTGFHALANVAEATNQDSDHFILNHLVSAMGDSSVDEKGNVTGFDLTKVEGVPSDIIKSIVAARSKDIEALQKRKADEQRYKLK